MSHIPQKQRFQAESKRCQCGRAPPQGYDVSTPDGWGRWCGEPLPSDMWYAGLADEYAEKEHRTREEAVAACWAHHDEIEARGYARCQADAVALAQEWADKESTKAVDFRYGHACGHLAVAFSQCEHVGAAERKKEGKRMDNMDSDKLTSAPARCLTGLEVTKILGTTIGMLVEMSDAPTAHKALRWMMEHWGDVLRTVEYAASIYDGPSGEGRVPRLLIGPDE